MATREAKRTQQEAANAIRRALPDEDTIAAAMCESGYGLAWNRAPEQLKKILSRAARTSLYVSASLMAREPEVLKQANEARIEAGRGTGIAG